MLQRAVRSQRVVDTEGASVESEAEGTTIEGLDAIENKLVTEYGKLLDKGMVDQLINVKQAIPEAEKKYGANSWQAWQMKDTRTALVAEMYKNVMSELDSQLAEAQQENNAEAIEELQKRRDDLEQTAPQRLKDLVTEMQQREAELVTAEVEAMPEEAALTPKGQAVPQGQIVPQEEVKPAEQSVLQGQAVPQEEVKPAEESVKPIEEPTTEIQVGKQYLVIYKGQTYTGEVIKAGKANAIIRTTDGKQLTIPTKARWAEIEVTGEQMQEEEKAEEKQEAVTATYIVNEEQNTVEVKFSDKPAKETLDRLYTAGFSTAGKIRHGMQSRRRRGLRLLKSWQRKRLEPKSEAEPETKPEEKPRLNRKRSRKTSLKRRKKRRQKKRKKKKRKKKKRKKKEEERRRKERRRKERRRKKEERRRKERRRKERRRKERRRKERRRKERRRKERRRKEKGKVRS